jgi:hypothetical protein
VRRPSQAESAKRMHTGAHIESKVLLKSSLPPLPLASNNSVGTLPCRSPQSPLLILASGRYFRLSDFACEPENNFSRVTLSSDSPSPNNSITTAIWIPAIAFGQWLSYLLLSMGHTPPRGGKMTVREAGLCRSLAGQAWGSLQETSPRTL